MRDLGVDGLAAANATSSQQGRQGLVVSGTEHVAIGFQWLDTHLILCCARVTLEWMGWQQQALHRASQADEVLVTHVVDFNSSAVGSLRQVADFVGVGRRMADLKAVRGWPQP